MQNIHNTNYRKEESQKKITEKKRKCSFKTCVMFIRETQKREKDTWAYGI